MKATIHCFPIGDFLGDWIAMDLLQAERSIVFEALRPNLP
jgi:hypothetical protein